MKIQLLPVLAFLFCLSFASMAQRADLAAFVNPFIGTGGHGHTYPGASLPYGMVQLSPDTRLTGWDGCSGYHYSDSIVYGFSHTHLSGTGCSDYGDILLMPVTGKVSFKNTDYASVFSHSKEKAEAGYYSVFLEKPNVNVELTSTLRAGFHKYTFPASKEAGILIDLIHRDEVLESSIEIVGNNEVRGMRRSKAWAEDQWLYFVARFSKPFDSYVLNDNGQLSSTTKSAASKKLQLLLNFITKEKEDIFVKVAISAVSTEGALKNLEAEIPGWDFEGCRKAARDAWNVELHRIEVDGPIVSDLQVFYSALYHCMLAPNLYMDVDKNYRGRDNKIHRADGFDYYTVFSLWDTYRALHPLLNIIDQKRSADFINTFIAQYEQGGLLPVWELSANETFCMIGYHAVPVIADAVAKGVPGFDIRKAYKACVNSANYDRAGLGLYIKQGYVPGDQEHESVSKTLEYAYDDWCIAQIALKLDKKDDYEYYMRRAQNYKNVFNPSFWHMSARVNGGWHAPFDPKEVNNHYTEANAWQYGFAVPQDITGLMNCMKGKSNFNIRLDQLFNENSATTGRDQADISGLIGQYAHGNEPSHHMAYLYNYVGEPWKTQDIVHKILREFYSTNPDGLIGNEDCGQMSAWYVMSSLGFYQVCPGDLQMVIGSPIFPRARLNLAKGKRFELIANGADPNSFFVQNVIVNNQPLEKNWISANTILSGGQMVYELAPGPNLAWGSNPEALPVSEISTAAIVPAPFIAAVSRSFSDSLLIVMSCLDTKAEIYYTLDGSVPDDKKLKYREPFVIKENTDIKLIAWNKEAGKSSVVEGSFRKTIAGRSIKLYSTYENQYTAGGPNALIDGLRGTSNWRLGGWQGYQNADVDAVVDLGKEQSITKISSGYVQQTAAWIVLPTEVEYLISSDGENFKSLGILKPTVDIKDMNIQTYEFVKECNVRARYVRVMAKNYGKLPDWHESPGGDAHLFIDEITVE